tara:strand:- start:74 stop:706 length:633 start_codon:yes stop_codon:yes gene_type:complete
MKIFNNNNNEDKMTKFNFEKIDTTFKSDTYTGDELVDKNSMVYEYEFLKDHIEKGKIYLTDQEKEIWEYIKDIVVDLKVRTLKDSHIASNFKNYVEKTLEHRKSPTNYGYANEGGYTDMYPYEIVKVVSEQTIEVRRLDAEKDSSVELKWVSGGFAGHCVNQNEQKWIYKSNEKNPTQRIRRRKDGYFYSGHNTRFYLEFAPRKFHDYNF